MKWKLSAFREPFQAHKAGQDASELRPDMGLQRGESIASTARSIGGPGRKTGATCDAKSDRSGGGSTVRSGQVGGPLGGGIYGLGRGRRVVVKARFRKHQAVRRGGQQRVLAAHLRYLGRPNATGLERADAFFDAGDGRLDAADVPVRWAQDRHHWRIIVSPEEGDRLDLRRYVREYAQRLERELDTPLEWVAVTHNNTDQPHAHLVIRGRRGDGRDLVIPRNVVKDGLRHWAEELTTVALGARSDAEADAYLNRLAAARRPTELDVILMRVATTVGASCRPAGEAFDVQVPRGWSPEAAGRHHLERRLETLAGLGLAERTSRRFRRAKWRLRADFVDRLDVLADQEQGQDAKHHAATEIAAAPVQSQRGPHDRHERHGPKRPPSSTLKSLVGSRKSVSNASTDEHELG